MLCTRSQVTEEDPVKLLTADLIRDGGSVLAVFERADGLELEVFLLVKPRVNPGDPRQFSRLYAGSSVHNIFDPADIVARGSKEERDLLRDMDECIRQRQESAADHRAWIRLLELRECLEEREG